ncbi:hypothetical protein G7O57_001282 [Salmonella enterica]|nr:hypothetical protein [Salmonella enterica]EGA6599197.1 hypothetical protein [Salmonella enterica]EGP3755853.1 hypothetical protein [Salmonella enterica]EIG8310659.1 hypothetical protein [Salmonella enterica]EIV9014468.1 hypothetical protein [Salmonella enterica]
MAITSYSSSTPNDAGLLEQVWGALSGLGTDIVRRLAGMESLRYVI